MQSPTLEMKPGSSFIERIGMHPELAIGYIGLLLS